MIYWMENMKLYVSDIVYSYKDTIVGNLVNSGTSYLLLHIVYSWRSWEVDKYNWYLPMVMYCLGGIYK